MYLLIDYAARQRETAERLELAIAAQARRRRLSEMADRAARDAGTDADCRRVAASGARIEPDDRVAGGA